MSDTIEKITDNGKTVELSVAEDKKGKYWLTIVDADGNKTNWEDGFSSQEEALAEGRTAIKEEGIDMFIGNWGG